MQSFVCFYGSHCIPVGLLGPVDQWLKQWRKEWRKFLSITWICLRCVEKVQHIIPNGVLMVIYHGTKQNHLKQIIPD